jgi:alpha-L-fucosidase
VVWYPAETDVSIRPGWFYHPAEDAKVKSGQELLNIYFTSVGRNSLLLLNIPPDTRGLISDSDVKALKDWAQLRESLFKNNLLKGFTVHCVNGINNRMLVSDQRSFWTTKGKDSTAVIEFESPAPVSFNVLQLQEDITKGQRIEKFSLQYFQDGKWTEIFSGTTVGYKRLLSFKPVTSGKIRLVIESSRFNPTLTNVGLFKSDITP